jgi:hypothetical protein
MAHQLVLVLIQDPHANVFGQVWALLERHSMWSKVEPYKDYFTPCHWDGRLWEEGDAQEYVRRREQAFGEKHERDEKGYYRWADDNPEGHFDGYTLGGRWDGIFAGLCEGASPEAGVWEGRVEGNVCPIEALPSGLIPASVVTPDGQWHSLGWKFGGEAPHTVPLASKSFGASPRGSAGTSPSPWTRTPDYRAVRSCPPQRLGPRAVASRPGCARWADYGG